MSADSRAMWFRHTPLAAAIFSGDVVVEPLKAVMVRRWQSLVMAVTDWWCRNTAPMLHETTRAPENDFLADKRTIVRRAQGSDAK